MKELYNPKAFFTHAALLDQGFPHCPIFPTAASRRSLGRVSVPVWLIILSDQLPIVALVSFYLTNKLIGRGAIPEWPKPFPLGAYAVLATVSSGCPPLRGRSPRDTHPSATVHRAEARVLVRLACVKHAASVRSEPGSNSQVDFSDPNQEGRERNKSRSFRTSRYRVDEMHRKQQIRKRVATDRRPRIPSNSYTMSKSFRIRSPASRTG